MCFQTRRPCGWFWIADAKQARHDNKNNDQVRHNFIPSNSTVRATIVQLQLDISTVSNLPTPAPQIRWLSYDIARPINLLSFLLTFIWGRFHVSGEICSFFVGRSLRENVQLVVGQWRHRITSTQRPLLRRPAVSAWTTARTSSHSLWWRQHSLWWRQRRCALWMRSSL